MKRRELIKTFAKTALGTGLVAMLGTSTAAAAVPAETVYGLKVGQSYQYDWGLKLTFVKVLRDNRCPEGVNCVLAGHAVVVIRVDLGNQPLRTYKLRTTRNGSRISIASWPPGMVGFKTYSVQLLSLTPQPTAGGMPAQSDYRLSLGIDTFY